MDNKTLKNSTKMFFKDSKNFLIIFLYAIVLTAISKLPVISQIGGLVGNLKYLIKYSDLLFAFGFSPSDFISFDAKTFFAICLSIFCIPLSVTIMGFLAKIANKGEIDSDYGKKYIFENTINANFVKFLFVKILKSVFTSLAAIFFTIPGIIVHYQYYFAEQVACENPDLEVMDILKLTKERTKGHKMDLFKFDLSFIGWFFLTIVTFGVAGLYFQPYYQMSKAFCYNEYFSNESNNEGKIEIEMPNTTNNTSTDFENVQNVENVEYVEATENIEDTENI